VQIFRGSLTFGTGAVSGYKGVTLTLDWFYELAVALLIIWDQIPVGPGVGMGLPDNWKLVNLILLVLRGMRIIIGPLLERNIFADKKN